MTTSDTVSIPTAQEVVQARLRHVNGLANRFHNWGRVIAWIGVIATVAAIAFAITEPLPHWVLTVGIVGSVALGALGAILWLASVALKSHLSHYHASKFEVDQLRGHLAADCQQFVAGLDTTTLARLASQMQSVELANSLLTTVIQRMGEIEKRRQSDIAQLQREIAANERQRRADIDQFRETGRKTVEGLHEHVELLAAGFEKAIKTTQREAYAAGIRDVLDEIEHHRTERHQDGALADAPSLHEEIRRYLERQPRAEE